MLPTALCALQLTSLDLCGVAAVTDALAPTLASLFNLAVLRLNHTSCSDATVEWLTYGSRLHQWSTTVGQQHTAECSQALQGPAPSTSNQTQQWPRCVGQPACQPDAAAAWASISLTAFGVLAGEH